MILTRERRSYLADKLGDLANLIFAGLVIGQFISEKGFHVLVALIGLISGVWLYLISLIIKRQ